MKKKKRQREPRLDVYEMYEKKQQLNITLIGQYRQTNRHVAASDRHG